MPDAAPHPDLTWRPLTPADIPAWHRMIVATEAVDEPDEHFTPEDLGDELGAPSVDPAVDSRAALTPDGEILAAGLSTARPMGGPMRRYDFWGAVHPAWRGQGLGRRLLAWQIERAAERHAQDAPDVPGWAGLGAEEKREDVWRLAARAGLTPLRWFTTLHRPLTTTAPLDPVDLASGLHLVPLGEDLDEAVRLAHNDAWTDHWGYAASPAADWNARVVGLRNLRRDWSHVVVDEADDVVGYALNVSFEQDWEVQGFKEGYTLLLGVRRPWRGQGVAKALLTAADRAFRDAGMEVAALDVDSENPTGALQLYQGLGYGPVNRTALLATRFAPVIPA